MNKTELIKEFAKECKITQDESREFLGKLVDITERELKSGRDVTFMDLFKLEVKEKKGRPYKLTKRDGTTIEGVSESGSKIAFNPLGKIKNMFK